MNNRLVREEVDILKRPNTAKEFDAEVGLQVTIGDLHASTIKLLFILAFHGFIGISDQQYDALVRIYQKDMDSLTHHDLVEFNHLLMSLKFNNYAGTLRLIGDDFADRGKCDWFTLNLLYVMRLYDIKIEVLSSNHAMDFLLANEKKNGYAAVTLLTRDAGSMASLRALIQRGVLQESDVRQYVALAYQPIVKALSYTLSEDKKGITIYSHAPIGLNTVEALAKKLGVIFDDRTPETLGKTIDAVNDIFSEYVTGNKLHEIIDEQVLRQGYEGKDNEDIQMEKNPLEFILWNRNYDVIECPKKHLIHKYHIQYVHGHDSEMQYSPKHVFNLDNYLAKGNNTRGEYTAICSQQTQLRQPSLMVNKQPIMLTKSPAMPPSKSKLFRSQPIAIVKLSPPDLKK